MVVPQSLSMSLWVSVVDVPAAPLLANNDGNAHGKCIDARVIESLTSIIVDNFMDNKNRATIILVDCTRSRVAVHDCDCFTGSWSS